jgi:dipeptidyl aminopeptidase/acylaminoacyl peptidase
VLPSASPVVTIRTISLSARRWALAAILSPGVLVAQARRGLQPADLHVLKAVGDVQVSPDGSQVVYTVTHSNAAGRPMSDVRVMDLRTRRERLLSRPGEGVSGARWSPNGDRLAYFGRSGERFGVIVASVTGAGSRFIAPVEGTNHPLPSSGERLSWSPNGTRIAYVSATPGPEADANGDPMVITRYLYKPTASEGLTRFNDNKRLHIFVADVRTGAVRQLTTGHYYEHSIHWSPGGDEILFVSNREPDPDRFFNYDIFAVQVRDGTLRRLTNTKNAEYAPVWSPDGRQIAYLGTTRDLTSSETTMEDTHVWVMGADGSDRREVVKVDNRQGAPRWSADGARLYFTVQERGNVALFRQEAMPGATPERLVRQPGTVGSWSAGGGRVALAFTALTHPAELYLLSDAAVPGSSPVLTRLTALNDAVLAARQVAPVDSFTVTGPKGLRVQSFIIPPLGLAPNATAPLITVIHGGPHGQQGPAFNTNAQVYAAKGYGVLMVNYRGSTGYGQRHADAIFGDQNGDEAQDILVAVDSALVRYPWIDRQRLGVEGGSYGGQLANWLVTRTDRFTAAIPRASISNLVSFNYMAYYHDYLAVEFGSFPHQHGLMDKLWERSALRYVDRVKTPVMLVHGENDNDVPIAEAEQFYIALKDVGVETVMVRYPREGHGLRETKHLVDVLERSIAWYERWFGKTVQ